LTAKEERLRVHSREDETQIEALKAELESAWRQVHEIERYSSIEETRGGKVRHETRAIGKGVDAREIYG